MSLRVYLEGPEVTTQCRCAECGHTHSRMHQTKIYAGQITDNAGPLAHEVELYQPLWRPGEQGITLAGQLVEVLRVGLALLVAEQDRFEAFLAQHGLGPANRTVCPAGWGLYPLFVQFVEMYLEACELHPDATVRVTR